MVYRQEISEYLMNAELRITSPLLVNVRNSPTAGLPVDVFPSAGVYVSIFDADTGNPLFAA